jgi:predicted RNA binding protein YcfA (HicA-like mRNA interferase family)
MPKRYTSRELIRLIERDGWYQVAQAGSHKQFKHPAKPGRVTIVHPERDMHPKTARSILRQAGLRLTPKK